MIYNISSKQEKLIFEYSQKWFSIGFKTKVNNSEILHKTVNNIYNLIGLNQPKIILVDSPYQSLKSLVNLNKSNKNIGQPVGRLINQKFNLLQSKVKSQFDEQLWFHLRSSFVNELNNLFVDELEIILGNLLEERLEIELGNDWEKLTSLVWSENKLQPCNEWEPSIEFYYNSFSSWANISVGSICDFCISVLNCVHNSVEWNVFKNLINYCGWMFPYDNICIISNRPSIIRLDEQNNIHAEHLPAIQFADGFSVYANHGKILNLK
ncbi:hypothetical protein CLI64_12425 [Nostoc sp. CENA543]|uniref:DUF6745 domain-containing protein n=1 Tax=Nostoc sp. CENA543 TaxID=1869241 RepID=UPI000CA0A1EA|nr:hypothetical protein [Nostoc sp. CENA543]AUT01144.1 hypothetical protein CLI64_12425 [Nostoc sp. CENA543]